MIRIWLLLARSRQARAYYFAAKRHVAAGAGDREAQQAAVCAWRDLPADEQAIFNAAVK